jgi:rhodanese-related sulfurtransferase
MGFADTLKSIFGGTRVDYKEKIEQGAIVVDVRTPAEFKSGNYKGSKNIPLQKLSSSINNLKGKEVILVCRSGGRAASAKAMLKRSGITAYNAGAWQNLNR